MSRVSIDTKNCLVGLACATSLVVFVIGVTSVPGPSSPERRRRSPYPCSTPLAEGSLAQTSDLRLVHAWSPFHRNSDSALRRPRTARGSTRSACRARGRARPHQGRGAQHWCL